MNVWRFSSGKKPKCITATGRPFNTSDNDAALWVFHAALYLNTPLNELLNHGIMERAQQNRLPDMASKLSRSGWSLITQSFRELGIDIDEPDQLVASDIGPIPVHGEPYLSFLILFRQIIESGLPAKEIELGLNLLSGRDEFTAAVFAQLGPARIMMKRAGYQDEKK